MGLGPKDKHQSQLWIFNQTLISFSALRASPGRWSQGQQPWGVKEAWDSPGTLRGGDRGLQGSIAKLETLESPSIPSSLLNQLGTRRRDVYPRPAANPIT